MLYIHMSCIVWGSDSVWLFCIVKPLCLDIEKYLIFLWEF